MERGLDPGAVVERLQQLRDAVVPPLAPVATDGMRPCTPLKPCAPLAKYAVVFDEQPMPESFTSCSGFKPRPHNASMMAEVTESCPQPAQSVDIAPS